MSEVMFAPHQILTFLDNQAEAKPWLRSLGVTDFAKAHANLVGLTDAGLTVDLVGVVAQQLSVHLPTVADADMALNNLQRFVAASRNPIALGSLFERDLDSLPVLLQILSTSQYLANGLIRDPEGFDLLRITEGQPVSREILVGEIVTEVEALADEAAVMRALRRWKRRETLRVAYGDIIRSQPIDVVAGQISYVADALCEAALQASIRLTAETRGTPRLPDGRECGFVILALGKLGGEELNYSSDIDLLFLYQGDGKTDGQRATANREFFERVARRFIKLLTESTGEGMAYRVDPRLRPEGDSGPLVNSVSSARDYYDTRGRTWERQAFVKARPIAGDLELGADFLSRMRPWIYRRYLSRVDINGIKALKRRIESRAKAQQVDKLNVKTGHGGIRDIEFAIQFLQLLNGGDLPDIHTANTLEAIMALERDGCLTYQERSLLEENYAFLRKLEHRLQVMFDLQTHVLPGDDLELRKLAIRMGYSDDAGTSTLALDKFKAEYQQKTAENRKILDHLLHDAFGDDPQTAPEVDLILDPSPGEDTIERVLSPYGFRDVAGAYRDLIELSQENVQFLSTRRCRHFLASIAPELLPAIAATADPDATLLNLTRVSESLGGKGTLWELFSAHPASLDLYVRLCGATSYLSDLLVSNPGMIDELMDSMMLDRLPSQSMLQTVLDDLSRGAEDLTPILQSFKNSQHLSVGVRDILGKEDIRATHEALANIAEVILRKIAQHEFERLVERFGEPTIGALRQDDSTEAEELLSRVGQPCELIILALGKVGGREPNYHSDLDLIFLYDADGQTRPKRSRGKSTTNQHFFNELAQRISKALSRRTPQGRLYELDPRLRPTGQSGMLVTSLSDFRRYHLGGTGELWERQALCKARPIFGSTSARQSASDTVREIITQHSYQPDDADAIYQMRLRLQQGASDRNLKRGPGGTVDIEFLTQLLQLKNAAVHPNVLTPGTLDALAALSSVGCLAPTDGGFFTRAYQFLRSVESSLRLMNAAARHDLPTDEGELNKLAWLLKFASGAELAQKCAVTMSEVRQRFIAIIKDT